MITRINWSKTSSVTDLGFLKGVSSLRHGGVKVLHAIRIAKSHASMGRLEAWGSLSIAGIHDQFTLMNQISIHKEVHPIVT